MKYVGWCLAHRKYILILLLLSDIPSFYNMLLYISNKNLLNTNDLLVVSSAKIRRIFKVTFFPAMNIIFFIQIWLSIPYTSLQHKHYIKLLLQILNLCAYLINI